MCARVARFLAVQINPYIYTRHLWNSFEARERERAWKADVDGVADLGFDALSFAYAPCHCDTRPMILLTRPCVGPAARSVGMPGSWEVVAVRHRTLAG